jgi:cytochrome bd ubiquinol oxidase subunit I
VTAGAVGSSLAAFVIVYGLIFPAGVYYMIRLVQRGPELLEEGRPGQPDLQTARRPLSAAGPISEPAE